jgi:kinetochore protein NNF1
MFLLSNILGVSLQRADKKDCDDLFEQFDVSGSIDILHAVVTEAQARAESGKLGPDVWRESLDPRTSMRARAVPVLEGEKRRLQEILGQVCSALLSLLSLPPWRTTPSYVSLIWKC